MDEPHKFTPEINNEWYHDYNPKKCQCCGKNQGHPIHQKKFRKKPLTYKLWLESK